VAEKTPAVAMNKKTVIGVTMAIVIAIVVFILFAREKPAEVAGSDEHQAKLVEITAVEPGKVERVSELSGALEAGEETAVAFEVSGRILEMRYKEGDRVNAGTILARVDATEYSLQLTRARTGVEKAQVGYQQALDHFDRMKQLNEAGAISQLDFENAQNRLKVAEEDLAEASQALGLLEQDKAVLTAPISGTVLAKMADQGQVTGAGTPVYKIGQISTLKTILPVPDHEITAWKPGQTVVLELYNQERQAQVTRVFPATNRGTGTIGVEVSVPNPDHDWFPGQIVLAGRAEIKDGIYVPAGAVINRGEEKPYVFLVFEGKASKRAVTIGELFGDKLEVTSGLNPDEMLVVKGAEKLFEGDDVEVPGGNGR